MKGQQFKLAVEAGSDELPSASLKGHTQTSKGQEKPLFVCFFKGGGCKFSS